MKAPCNDCWNYREVTIALDGKLYCDQCFPDTMKMSDVFGMFGIGDR